MLCDIYRFICFNGFLVGAPCICESTDFFVCLNSVIVIAEAGGGNTGPSSCISGAYGVIGVVLRATSLPISMTPGRESIILHNYAHKNNKIKSDGSFTIFYLNNI